MTNPNVTELVCVLDRSGSMYQIIDDAIGGINRFIEDQKESKVGEALMTIVLFDTEFKTVYESMPVQDVPPFTRETYKPRGSTALLDAVGQTIESVGNRLRNLPEDKRPGKVMFVILTDGHENSSTRYSHEHVKAMIDRQQNEWQWKFIYLSADVDAFAHGGGLNIGTRVAYRASGQSIGATYSLASTAARQYREQGNFAIMDSCVDISEGGDVTVQKVDRSTTDGDVSAQKIESTTDGNVN